MALLWLMIWSATVTLPTKSLAKNFPEDIQQALEPRLDALPVSGKRVLGMIILTVLLLGFIALFIIGGIDGMNNNFTYLDYLVRFLIMSYGVKAFDIIGLDFFLITRTHFFQHYFPETEGCAGWKRFGYNRKQQIKQIISMGIISLLLALFFSLIKTV
jgi:heme/copper-type cytochrome/quinol oxidase subunit 1